MTDTNSNPAPIARAFVREDKIADLVARIAKTNKQAAKVGAEPITCERTGKEEERVTKVVRDALGREVEIRHTFIEFEVFGEQPKLPGGWILLGVIDHREKVALVNEVPGRSLPSDQRDRGPICDHCNANRRRSDTFVLQDEDGRVVQVGRQCLADFLGLSSNNPEHALLFYIGTGEILDFPEDDGEPSFRAYGASWRLDVLDTVKLSGAIIETNGFVARSRCEETGQAATSSRVLDFIDPPSFSGYRADEDRRAFREWVAEVEAKITPALDAEAASALQWASEEAAKPDASEFIRNLGAFVECETVARKYIGSVVWIFAGYRKATARLHEAEAKAKIFGASEHFGAIGKRQEADLTLIEVRPLESDFGTTYLSTFADSDGNKAKWFASNDPRGSHSAFEGGWEVGQARHVKLTPKKHSEWNGTPETVVNRVAPFNPTAKKPKRKAKTDKVLRAEILEQLSDNGAAPSFRIADSIEGLGDKRSWRLLEALRDEGRVELIENVGGLSEANPNSRQWQLPETSEVA